MTAPTTTHQTMALAVMDPNTQNEWITVHRDGCSHLKRKGADQAAWTIPAVSSLEEAAAEIGSDFIQEGSMTIEDCVEQITWAPCVKLPRWAVDAKPRKARKVRKLAAVPDPEPTPEPAKRKSLPNAERRAEATHPDGGSAVSHGKCPSCGARKGHVCTGKSGQPTNAVHAPRMRAWEAAGSPSLPMPNPARKRDGVWVVVK